MARKLASHPYGHSFESWCLVQNPYQLIYTGCLGPSVHESTYLDPLLFTNFSLWLQNQREGQEIHNSAFFPILFHLNPFRHKRDIVDDLK